MNDLAYQRMKYGYYSHNANVINECKASLEASVCHTSKDTRRSLIRAISSVIASSYIINDCKKIILFYDFNTLIIAFSNRNML